jgi:hypothetical protein
MTILLFGLLILPCTGETLILTANCLNSIILDAGSYLMTSTSNADHLRRTNTNNFGLQIPGVFS